MGFLRAALIAVDIATVGLLVWKFVTGTPPRRRALAVGAPIAICYLLAQATYQTAQLVNAEFGGATSQNLNGPLQWVIAGFRAAPWYGFLFSLIAAELFAARVLRDVVRRSMGRPPLRELEAILREPLGDPGLRLGFWRASTGDWVGRDGAVLEPPKPGQVLTEGAREGSPAVAIVHDAQLSEDPELLQAAGAAALLAQENAELDAAWKRSLRELADSRDKLVESRARLVRASDRERRRLERDLHDGAQQRLMAVQIKLGRIEERVVDGNLAADLNAISSETAAAVEELRALAHGIYPPALRLFGLVDALRAFAMTAPIPITIVENGVGRCSRTVEAAIYFCATEAVQNATKHAGPDARVTITLGRDSQRVHFAIADDGAGMDNPASADGEGLTNMRDRLGAVSGELEITSRPGLGTTVSGTVPLGESQTAPATDHSLRS